MEEIKTPLNEEHPNVDTNHHKNIPEIPEDNKDDRYDLRIKKSDSRLKRNIKKRKLNKIKRFYKNNFEKV